MGGGAGVGVAEEPDQLGERIGFRAQGGGGAGALLVGEHQPVDGAAAGGGEFTWTAAIWLTWASPHAKGRF